jgi:hypothetical protein
METVEESGVGVMPEVVLVDHRWYFVNICPYQYLAPM